MSSWIPAAITAGANLLGGLLSDKGTASANNQNIKMQRDFAQKGIQWKVADAKKAGIHPLYALGASTNMPTMDIKPEKGTADAIRNAGDILSKSQSELTQAQIRAADADAVLKLARASEISRTKQNMNSQQDKDIVNAQELEPARVKVSERHGLKHGQGGRLIKTPVGPFLFKSNQPSAQAYEDETGEAVAFVASTMESANAWGRFKQFQAEAKKMYPGKYGRDARKYKEFNAKQRRRQAMWLNKRVQLFLKHGD